MCSAALRVLGGAIQLGAIQRVAKQCRHPARGGPPRLRQLPTSPNDVCVELLVAQGPGGHPCCILPPGGADAPTCSGKVGSGTGLCAW